MAVLYVIVTADMPMRPSTVFVHKTVKDWNGEAVTGARFNAVDFSGYAFNVESRPDGRPEIISAEIRMTTQRM